MTSLRNHDRQEFPAAVKRTAFRRSCGSKGRPHCEGCGRELRSGEIIYEHVQPDGLGGQPTADNCKVFGLKCCATPKTKDDNARMAKADAILRANYGLKPKRKSIASRGFPKPAKQHSATRPIRQTIGAKNNLQAPDRVGSYGEAEETKTELGSHLGGDHHRRRERHCGIDPASLSLTGGSR